MCGKRRDIFTALTQRRDFYRKDSQTLKQMLPEAAFINLLRQVTIGRRDDANTPVLARRAAASPASLVALRRFRQGTTAAVGQFDVARLYL
jgi:hypothetical protein